MKRTMILVALSAVLALNAAPAMAAVFGDGGTALDKVLDDITVTPSPTPGQTSVNVLTDEIVDGQDKQWHITATGGSISTMIIEVADFKDNNIFGVYDIANPTNKVTIFAGSASAGAQTTLSVDALGGIYINHVKQGDFGSTWFGYFLDSSANTGGGLWYSDTSLNVADGLDHMYAYQGTNTDTVQIAPWGSGLWTDSEFILAWEDLAGPYGQGAGYSDRDFTDMVVMVESVQVPVPGAVLLGVLGLSVAGARLRKRS